MAKSKLTLSVEVDKVKTLKIKAIQYDIAVSELVEVLALIAERDKKVFNELVDKYKPEVIKNRNVKKKSKKVSEKAR